jgi:hypothetical protein
VDDEILRLLLSGAIGGGAVAGVLLAALETRLRKVFATDKDMTGATQRIDGELTKLHRKTERNAGLFVALDDRVGDLEQKTSVLEERQTQQWGRISEQMSSTARTIERVAQEMREIAGMQQSLALELERRHQPRKTEG